MLFVNQVCFVLALDATTATTIGLLIGTIPIFAALIGVALGRERPRPASGRPRRSRRSASALVALGSGGDVSGSYVGILLGLAMAATWAAYSVAVTPLMQTYSALRVSAVVIRGAWLLIAVVGLPDTRAQDWQLGWEIWVLLVLATLGPLVVTNILWFRSLHQDRPGASHACRPTCSRSWLPCSPWCSSPSRWTWRRSLGAH